MGGRGRVGRVGRSVGDTRGRVGEIGRSVGDSRVSQIGRDRRGDVRSIVRRIVRIIVRSVVRSLVRSGRLGQVGRGVGEIGRNSGLGDSVGDRLQGVIAGDCGGRGGVRVKYGGNGVTTGYTNSSIL